MDKFTMVVTINMDPDVEDEIGFHTYGEGMVERAISGLLDENTEERDPLSDWTVTAGFVTDELAARREGNDE